MDADVIDMIVRERGNTRQNIKKEIKKLQFTNESIAQQSNSKKFLHINKYFFAFRSLTYNLSKVLCKFSASTSTLAPMIMPEKKKRE